MMTIEKPHETGSFGDCTITAFHYTKIVNGGEEMCSTRLYQLLYFNHCLNF